jgi:hypothetical protein
VAVACYAYAGGGWERPFWCDVRFGLGASELEKLSYANNGFVVHIYSVADVNIYM